MSLDVQTTTGERRKTPSAGLDRAAAVFALLEQLVRGRRRRRRRLVRGRGWRCAALGGLVRIAHLWTVFATGTPGNFTPTCKTCGLGGGGGWRCADGR